MSGALNHSPADVIRRVLIGLGLGVDPPSSSWPIYADNEPDTPDNCITVYNTAGVMLGRLHPNGEKEINHGIQVKVRSATSPTGYAKANALAMGLDGIYQYVLRLDSTTYSVHAVHRTSDIIAVGKDPISSRKIYTINATVTMKIDELVTVSMTKNPTAAASVAPGDNFWSNPTNVFSSNDTFATSLVDGGENTETLRVTGFGFSIPSTATILGIEARIEHQGHDFGVGVTKDHTVQLRKASGAVGDNKASAVAWNKFVNEIFTYGGPTDLWGAGFTPSEINDTNFGLDLRSQATGFVTNELSQVDHIQLTVYYEY